MHFYKPKAYNRKIAGIQSKKFKKNVTTLIVFGVLLMQTAVSWDFVIPVIVALSFPHRYMGASDKLIGE